MKKKLLLILSILLIPATLAAVYYFKILDTTAGLTSSQVNSIIKDMRGYIWIGTPSGLYRYDGYIFKNFQSNSQDGSSTVISNRCRRPSMAVYGSPRHQGCVSIILRQRPLSVT